MKTEILPVSVRRGFLIIWCVFAGLSGGMTLLRPAGGDALQQVAGWMGIASAPLFLGVAWLLWTRSWMVKVQGSIAFVVAMMLSAGQIGIGFAVIAPPGHLATAAFAVGLIAVLGYFLWLWAGVLKEPGR